ncbi:MAG: hybrid sensor histidine kinase/response regulator [Burkholderiaceae bacterium]
MLWTKENVQLLKKTDSLEYRILIYASGGKDAQIASQVIAAAGVASHVCSNYAELMAEMTKGCGAVLTVEEVFSRGALAELEQFIERQATWSDLPILLMTYQGANSAGIDDAVKVLGNLTLLERPVRTATLISAVKSALRARTRQYQVRETDKRKDEFLASLGHELRNPLGPIRTSMQVLKRMYPASSGVTEVREMVERQVTHLTRLVDDLLDVARITSGKVELKRERVSLEKVIVNAVEICKPILAKFNQKIDIDQPDKEVVLDADPVRLVQSLSNVLANAAKYSNEPARIFLTASVHDETVVFSIRDSGIGIEKESLSRIFELFAQNDPAPGRILDGLGIGLSLTKQFTEMHGGTIEAKSDGPGKGSEFILSLPIVISEPASEQATDWRLQHESISSASRKILFVDDNRDGADILRLLFESDGFMASTAYNGIEAIEAVKRSPPDVIVMDIGMPGMDGYEAARRIRDQPAGKDILMIALTGWGQESARLMTNEAGFDHHMVKPVNFDTLKRFLNPSQI